VAHSSIYSNERGAQKFRFANRVLVCLCLVFYELQIMNEKLAELKKYLVEISDLQSLSALAYWDQATYMPAGGATARGRQISLLDGMAHEKFIAPRIGELLEELRPLETEGSFENDDVSLIRVTRREWQKATRIPTEFQARFSDHTAQVYQAWTVARPENNFAAVEPLLEKTLEFSREMASFFPQQNKGAHIADSLIDFSDEGMTVGVLRPLFTELKNELVPLVEAITARPGPDVSCLHKGFNPSAQIAFGNRLATHIGYDWSRGRNDLTHHPFMTKFSLGDVRITNRANESDISDALFGTLHETGHALYEQGIARELENTPLAGGTSSGVHESQSRLWENLVGRSRSFWEKWFPELQAAFLEQLDSVSVDEWHRAINRVGHSLIRTDADEVTYNLHIMVRFELELQLLEGKLAVRDLPAAWRALYREYLGIEPQDDRDGVLQDVHWFAGTIGGAFQGYTLGNILSAQFYDAALQADPQIEKDFASAEYSRLHDWLRENIYRHGAKFAAPEIIQRATGGPLSIAPYMKYLREKYSALYSLS
jgi:carboxypeptidase Taq